MPRTVRGVYANVRATPKMPQADVVEDLLALLAFHPSWVALNEAAKVRRYRRAIRRLFDHEDWRWLFLSRRLRNTILVKRDVLRTITGYSHRLNRGLAGLNPTRRASVALLQYRATGDQFWLVVPHLPNGKDNPRKRMRGWRIRAWDKAWHRLVGLLEDLEDTGLPVVMVGDLNDKHTPEPIRGWRWVSSNGRIVKAGSTVYGTDTDLITGLATDHPGLVVRLPL